MMYGISSNAWLKQTILFALEEETEFISSRELTYIVGDYSQSTIKKICRDIQEDIESLYPSDLVTLIIDQRNGIKLIRKPYVNLQKLLSTIFSAELGYELLQQLLLQRTISTIDFCNTYYISESQLRRKIKEINASLVKHDISISLSSTITIFGEEHKLRAFFYVFLFAIHRQFSHIEWIENKEDFATVATQIAQELEIETDSRTIELLSIWCFITRASIKSHLSIIFNENEQQILQSISLPQRPDFLTDWMEEDWQLLVVAIYASDIIDFHLTVNLQQMEEVTHLDDASIWITLFEYHFLPLTDVQQEFVYKKFVKQLLSYYFFEPDENVLNNFTEQYAEELKVDYPLLFSKYEFLWDQFIEKVSEPAYEYFHIESLLLCFYLVPNEIYYPQIKLFIRSDLTFLNTKHLEFRVSTRFCDKYSLKFTRDIHQADIILSTVSVNGMEEYTTSFKNLVPIVLIDSKISETDFAKIEAELLTITHTLLANENAAD